MVIFQSLFGLLDIGTLAFLVAAAQEDNSLRVVSKTNQVAGTEVYSRLTNTVTHRNPAYDISTFEAI